MIVKGRSRSSGTQLAGYLISDKNDAVKVLDIRGTVASSLNPIGLRDALNEMDAVAGLVRGDKSIFHVALNPNDLDRMTHQDWQSLITKTEKALGFEGQPRVVVQHTKDGKDHLHIAWSRVDTEKGKLIPDSFCNLKMVQAAREFELENGKIRTPDRNKNQRAAALNRILKEERYEVEKDKSAGSFNKSPTDQRAKEKQRQVLERSEKPEKTVKRDIASAWHQSINGEEFKDKLERRGYRLIRGRRGAVVMDDAGEIYSPARMIDGTKVKEINAKCADVIHDLPTEDQARHHGRKTMLTPRQAQRLVKSKLTWELSNDPTMERNQREFEP